MQPVENHERVEGEQLAGGRINAVRRVGNSVVRSRTANSTFVHALLTHLATAGWNGAPRVLDHSCEVQETLTFLEGTVPWQRPTPAWAVTDEALVGVAVLVRQLHDLTAGTELAGRAEVVCHHDLSPANTVYRPASSGWTPVAFVDWDLAGPGRRVHDIGHVCWQWLDLGPTVADLTEARRRITLVVDAYGLNQREELIPAVLWWQQRCWRGIEAAAATGEAAMQRLVADGTSATVRAAHAWTLKHHRQLAPAAR